MPRTSTGGLRLVSTRSATASAINDPGPAGPHAVLDGHDQVVTAGVGDHLGVEGAHHPDVPDGHLVALGRQDVGGFLGGFDHLSDRQDADRAGLLACPRRTRRALRPEPTWSAPT